MGFHGIGLAVNFNKFAHVTYFTGLAFELGEVADAAPVIIVPGIFKDVARGGAPFSNQNTDLVTCFCGKAGTRSPSSIIAAARNKILAFFPIAVLLFLKKVIIKTNHSTR